MEMPKLQEQHRKLQVLAGTWTGEETMFPSPWDPKGGKAAGRFQSRLDLDGFFLVTDYVQQRGGQTSYRGHGVYGYDAETNGYTMHWFDSMGSPCNEPMRGKWEGNSLILEQVGPMGHSRHSYRLEGDRFSLLMEVSQDGKQWGKFLEATYARA